MELVKECEEMEGGKKDGWWGGIQGGGLTREIEETLRGGIACMFYIKR